VLIARKTDGDLRHLRALRDYLRDSPPDVLLSAMTYTNLVALWARQLAGSQVPVVVSERISLSHHIESKLAKPAWRWEYLLPVVSQAYAKADGLVTVSDSVAEDLARSAGLERDHIRTIYNPVVDDALLAMAGEPLEHPWFAAGERPVVLGVGRLIEQKDFPTLLRAFALLCQRRTARLMILGEGRLRPELEALARKLGIDNYVQLPGFAENPYRYMARAGVFALSSIYEGLPGVLIQALACGCPVVSTDCPGGSAEILDGGRVGSLVPMRDPQALADALHATLTQPRPAQVLTDRAKDFSVASAGRNYLDYLDAVVKASA
jgi:glycosyltransferase involved in cell wall biosynthesis